MLEPRSTIAGTIGVSALSWLSVQAFSNPSVPDVLSLASAFDGRFTDRNDDDADDDDRNSAF